MISQRLRHLRRSKGYTLDQLSEISGVNRGTIHRIELDQVSPRVDTLALLCEALGTDFQGFFRQLEAEPGPGDVGLLETEPTAQLGPMESDGPHETSDLRHGLLDWLEHLEALIHCSADGFAVTDQDGFIIYESQVSILLRGTSGLGRRTRPWYICAHPDEQALLSAGLQAVLDKPDEVLPLDYRVPTSDGGWRWVRSTLRNQLKHPAIQGIVINTQDITVWKNAEEQRNAIQAFEAQLQVMRAMTAEFSNLWMGVQGHIELSRMNGADPLQLAGIQDSLDRARGMLDQMRDVCGHPTLDLKPVDLNELIEAQGAASLFRLELAAGLPRIAADRDLLTRLLVNVQHLLMEGRTELQGPVRVTTFTEILEDSDILRRFKDQGLERGGTFVVLEIEDPGSASGAPSGWRSLAPVGLTGQVTWTGLPLPAILRTLRDHRAGIAFCESKGSPCIRIHFPVSLPQEPEAAPAESRPQARRILVVDDEEYLLLATQQMLSSLGYATLGARGGREALDIHAREGNSIGLILLDLNMPFVNGEETYREIRKLDAEVKVVLCTGSVAPVHDPFWSNARLSGILRKPFGYQDLKRITAEVLPA